MDAGRSALAELKRLIHDTGSTLAVLQVGDASFMRALARARASEVGWLTMRVSPAASS